MSIERRIPNWDMTIHKNDTDKDGKCLFDKDYLKSYLRECFKPNCEIYFCLHDKDLEDDGITKKEDHIHLVIKMAHNQGKNFSTMKRLFPMSHLEEAIEPTNSVLYLTHETPKAIEEGKYRYDRNEVVNVNETDISKYYDKPVLESFDYDKIEEYILDRGYYRMIDFGRVFGYSVIAPRWNTIKEIVRELYEEQRYYAKATLKEEESPLTSEVNKIWEK